jgi:hypothetical protein
LPVLQFGKNSLLLALNPDKRPSYNETSLVLYNYIENKILDMKECIGMLKSCNKSSQYTVVGVNDNRMRIRLVKEVLGISDGPEDYIEDWMIIENANGKLKCSWEK